MKCYLCNSPVSPYFVKNGYLISLCRTCGLGVTSLGKDYNTFVRDYYIKGYFTGDPRLQAYSNYKGDKPYIVRNMKKYLGKIRPLKPSGKILDVGCALGFFVELAIAQGYDAYGFDPSAYAVEEAKKVVGDGKIIQGTIGSVRYAPQSYDCITLLDVFEHLADPERDLRKLRSYLKDDGIMLIATGDTKSVMAKALKRRWTFYNPPQHLYFFNKRTLTTLLGKLDLEPVAWFRIGKWLSLRYVLHLARTSGESEIAQRLFRTVEGRAVGKLPLFLPVRDNMVVIVRKKL